MLNFSNNASSLDWDATIENDDEGYVVLPAGDYNAVVDSFDRARHNGSPKIPPCNKAVIHFLVSGPDGPVPVKTDLLLHEKMEWKLSSFFRAIGLKKQGERLKMDWGAVCGKQLRVHIRPRTFIASEGDERTINEIDKFYDYDESFFSNDPEWMKEAMAAEDAGELEDIF